MRNTKANSPKAALCVARSLVLLLVQLLMAGYAASQTVTNFSPTQGSTPRGLAPGSPAGSYSLSGFDTINPYSAGLNFNLPLLKIGGRGTSGYTMTLPIERKWRINKTVTDSRIGCESCEEHFVTYTVSANSGWWRPGIQDFGPGMMVGRYSGHNLINTGCFSDTQTWQKTLTRLTFITADGTEYEFRDKDHGGEPLSVPSCSQGASRGRVFISADGTAATFISDTTIHDAITPASEDSYVAVSGYLVLRDGTRYRIDAGKVSWIRDRNGNMTRFLPGKVIDSLNREVLVSPIFSPIGIPISTQISFKGFNGAPRTIRILYDDINNALRPANAEHPAETIKTFGQLFPGILDWGTNNQAGDDFFTRVISSVELPNGRSYRFFYNSYGELARVELPTGGAFEYDWTGGVLDMGGNFETGPNYVVYREVTERRTYKEGGVLEGRTLVGGCNTGIPAGDSCRQIDHVDPNNSNTLLQRTKHYYHGIPGPNLYKEEIHYSKWDEGKEYKTEFLALDGVNVLRRVDTNWVQRSPVSWWPTNQLGPEPANDPRVTSITTTLLDVGKVALTTFSYDDSLPFNNRADVYEYDFGSPSNGPLLRRTHTDYVTSESYVGSDGLAVYAGTAAHIRSLPLNQWVSSDAAGLNKRSFTTYEYDNYTDDNTIHEFLTPRTDISGLCTTFNSVGVCANTSPTTYSNRGNITSVTSYAQAVNQTVPVTVAMQYDIAGNVLKFLDARSIASQQYYATTAEYADRFGTADGNARLNDSSPELSSVNQHSYALPTLLTNPLGHTTYTQYDFYLGQPVDGEDANGSISSATYNDLLDRPNQVISAVNDTSVKTQTTFEYQDAERKVTRKSDLSSFNDKILKTITTYDGLGRSIETQQYEDGTNYIAIQQQYDSMGRVFKTSNPYRPLQFESPAWTTTTFDALGRVKTVTTPDNATVTTVYVGNEVTVIDQDQPTGKRRKTVTDALGRLKEVYEDPGPAPDLNYLTSYGYDVLDNLISVSQGDQQRFFMYDSLKRLIRARNPEQNVNTPSLDLSDPLTGNTQWSTAYQYDSNGNLSQRIDARGVVSTYVYDRLNRNTNVTYTNDPANTSHVTRLYDGATTGIGRLWKSQTSQDSVTIDSYDALGRPQIRKQQYLGGPVFTVQRTYDRAGNVLSQTYPSGHTVTYQYDPAGRITNFSGNLGDGETRAYASSFKYDSAGRLQQEQYGTLTPLFHKLHYNVRGQLFDVRLSTQSWQTSEFDGNRGVVINYYSRQNFTPGFSGSDNNGNVTRSETHNPDGTFWRDDYTNDDLNRLTSVTEQHNGQTTVFAQHFSYDQYGNRWIDAAASWGGINELQFGVNPANNRLVAPQGYNALVYDATGNLTKDPTSINGDATFVYDAENRLIRVDPPPPEGEIPVWAPTMKYRYDADGRRVQRTTLSNTWQIYGMDGELLAEYYMGSQGPAPTYVEPVSTLPQKEYGYRNGQLLVTATNGDNERVKRFITNFYFAALGREPSSTELNNQYAALTQAATQGQSQLLMAGRQMGTQLFDLENANGAYNARQRTDTQFVADLYFAYLQRTPESGGLSFWLGWLQTPGNTRIGLRGAFGDSIEFSAVVATLYGIHNGDILGRVSRYVSNMYLGVPGNSGNLNNDTATVEVASAESQSLAIQAARTVGINLLQPWVTDTSKTNDQFVTALFGAFLQREASATELNNWVATVQLQGRNQTLQSFASLPAVQELAGTLYREILWLTSDHLGTPRMISERSGSLTGIKRHDYLPFGEELYASTGGRTTAQGYTASDNVRQKFTSKERDIETSLDWFGPGRYYSSTQGRFTSVDPLGASAKAVNPQTWNRYTYVLNRPTIAIDPDGLSTIVITVSPRAGGGTGNATIQVFDRNGRDVAVRNESNRIEGRAVGQGRDRAVRENDTPFGVYRTLPNYNGSNANGTQGGIAGISARGQDLRFGTGIVAMQPVSGEVVDNGRSAIYIHGGGRPLARALEGEQPLTPTQGCVRVHNNDINALITTVNGLATNNDPISNIFIGDVDTINAQANETDAQGNYRYPELRRSGFGTPDAQGRPTGNTPAALGQEDRQRQPR